MRVCGASLTPQIGLGPGACCIARVHRANHPPSLLLVAVYRPGARAYSIEFPSGLVDAGESLEEAAVRELREETGYSAASCRIRRTLGHCDPWKSSENEAFAMLTVWRRHGAMRSREASNCPAHPPTRVRRRWTGTRRKTACRATSASTWSTCRHCSCQWASYAAGWTVRGCVGLCQPTAGPVGLDLPHPLAAALAEQGAVVESKLVAFVEALEWTA